MAGMKTSVTRFGGRSLARLIGYVASSSTIVFEPADLRKRLRATHPCIIASWHGQFMMLCQLHPGDITVPPDLWMNCRCVCIFVVEGAIDLLAGSVDDRSDPFKPGFPQEKGYHPVDLGIRGLG